METIKKLNTTEKALQLNLDENIYGTIAEIGGGQEVAAHFFQAGAASGSIAKTMSAYDMKFSDAIYGKSARHVCEEKLVNMLDREYSLLSERLVHRAKRTQFFAFANTVETINFDRSNEGHGWIGLKFQKHPGTEPNVCIIHVLLKDNDPRWQQDALGKIGVNLLHSCYAYSDAEDILNLLRDNIHKSRVEVDMFRIEGPDFHHVDNRLMSLKLVKNGLTHATLFGPDGNVLQPSESLYKKNILALRGRFRPVTLVNVDMMISGSRAFKKEEEVDNDNIITLVELTLNDLTLGGDSVDESDFLDRVDLLCLLGQTVLISNFQEHYRLASYLSFFTKSKLLGLIIGVNNLGTIFEEKYYQNLNGGLLESFSRLFGSHVKLYVYPALTDENEVVICDDFQPADHLKYLFQHFRYNNQIQDLKKAKTENLHIISNEVLEMIQAGNDGWETMVPNRVAEAIKKNHYFSYPYPLKADKEDLISDQG
ncbi:MAG: TonB-dependent receptor [Cytophagales bacterium]|nr:TonB-dependent receptor [Cytophagales bacterium]